MINSKNKLHFAVVSIVLAGCLWGIVGVFVRYLVGLGLDNMTIVACRFFFAFLIMATSLMAYDRNLLRIKVKDVWIFISSGFLCMALFNFFYNVAIVLTSLSLSAVLLCTAPLYVVIISHFLFKESITKSKIYALILAFLGGALVSGILEDTLKYSLPGIFSGVVSGFGYGMYSIVSRYAMDRGYKPLTITTYSFLFAAAGSIFFADINQLFKVFNEAPLFIGFFLVVHSIACSVLPYVLYTIGLRYIEPGRAAILASFEPVMATLVGFFLYKEAPTIIEIIGIISALTALTILSRIKD